MTGIGFEYNRVCLEGFDGGLFDGSVHALSLPVGPRVVRLGEFVNNAIFIANSAKDVYSQKSLDRLVLCRSVASPPT